MRTKNFRLFLIAAVCASALLSLNGAENNAAQKNILPDRWFFAFDYGNNPGGVTEIKRLIDVAADHGLNGMVLSSFYLETITFWQEAEIKRLQEVAAYCQEKGIEFIPTGLSAGYSGGMLRHDRSLAAALPVQIRLRAHNGILTPVPSMNLLQNGDLAQVEGHRFKSFSMQERPGEVSFLDQNIRPGKNTIRLENYGRFTGHGRIVQPVRVEAGKSYRFSVKYKTEDMQPANGFKLMVYLPDRALAEIYAQPQPTQDWKEIALDYYSDKTQEVLLYAGLWNGKQGRFWLADFHFGEQSDLSDIVRREGTPLSLRSSDGIQLFKERADFFPVPCRADLQSIKLTPRTTIKEGDELLLNCYRIPYVQHSWGRQISLCMSNPDLYTIWEQELNKLYEVVKFRRYLLSMDEIRNGGGCAACQARNISMAEILGDCVIKQQAMLKRLDPEMEVLVWSDMFDPAHSARNNYYGVVGDFTGSWKYIPKDIVIMCWNHEIRDKSLPFFAKQGFRTFAAAYYDGKDLSNPREWLESLHRTPDAQGIMYTTWERKYKLLAPFGDLVSGRSNK